MKTIRKILIALVIANRSEELDSLLAVQYSIYAQAVDLTRYQFCLCAADEIDIKCNKIAGWFYDNIREKEGRSLNKFADFTDKKTARIKVPSGWSKKEGEQWPRVFYLRTRIAKQLHDELTACKRNIVFNWQNFDKYIFWQLLSLDPFMKKHLPETCLLNDNFQAAAMLEKYDELIFKPIRGSLAVGIFKAQRISSGKWKLSWPLQQVGIKKLPLLFTEPEEIRQIREQLTVNNYIIWEQNDITSRQLLNLADRFKQYGYLLQQAIDLPQCQQRKIDFRLIMQKNEQKKWDCSAVIARMGKPDSVISNFTADGYTLRGKQALISLWQLSERQAEGKMTEMINICRDACRLIESSGRCIADVGFDLALDIKLNIWLFETNMLHFHTYPLIAFGDRELYRMVAQKTIKYAAAVAQTI